MLENEIPVEEVGSCLNVIMMSRCHAHGIDGSRCEGTNANTGIGRTRCDSTRESLTDVVFDDTEIRFVVDLEGDHVICRMEQERGVCS